MEPRVCQSAGTCLILHASKSLAQTALPLERGGFESKSISQVTAELLASKATANLRPRYLTSLGQYLAQFARGREQTPLADFTVADVEGWLNRYAEAYTRQTWLNRLSALFAFAVRRGIIAVNPCDRIERVRVDRNLPVIFSPAQVKTILAAVPTAGRAYFILAMFAGIRPEEIERLDWAQINLADKTVRVEGKTRRRRLVPLEPEAAALLAGCPLQRGPVAPSHMTLRRMKRRLRLILGLPRWPQDVLRHTAASYLLARHQDAAKVALWLGNSEKVLLSHYHNPVSAADCVEFWNGAL